MEKIYQVFVSSTFQDLQDERKEVMQALLELDCMPAGMELFPASNDDQWTLIKRVIDTCDYYLLIIGGRYGSTNNEGKSYTQMEFEYALDTGKPIISFLPQKPEDIPSGKCEQDSEKKRKLDDFKELAQKKLVRYWTSPEDLGSKVSRSMIKLIKDFPAEGWIRAGSAVDERSIKEISRLQKENSDLKEKLYVASIEAPKGAAVLSQGDDTVNVGFSFKEWNSEKQAYDSFSIDVACSWNELFMAIAPHLINEGSDHKILEALTLFIKEKSEKNVKKYDFNGFNNCSNFKIELIAFNIIKVQFRALGLIALSDKKRQVSDKNTYWKLTPYGDRVMTQLLAIKK